MLNQKASPGHQHAMCHGHQQNKTMGPTMKPISKLQDMYELFLGFRFVSVLNTIHGAIIFMAMVIGSMVVLERKMGETCPIANCCKRRAKAVLVILILEPFTMAGILIGPMALELRDVIYFWNHCKRTSPANIRGFPRRSIGPGT